jgi:hypothetical protein
VVDKSRGQELDCIRENRENQEGNTAETILTDSSLARLVSAAWSISLVFQVFARPEDLPEVGFDFVVVTEDA